MFKHAYAFLFISIVCHNSLACFGLFQAFPLACFGLFQAFPLLKHEMILCQLVNFKVRSVIEMYNDFYEIVQQFTGLFWIVSSIPLVEALDCFKHSPC